MAKKKKPKGKRYPESERNAAVERLKKEDPTTVSKETGLSVDSLRRWARAKGIALIDGRRKGADTTAARPKSKAVAARASKGSLPIPEPVLHVTMEGLTAYIDARVDKRVEEVFAKLRVNASTS